MSTRPKAFMKQAKSKSKKEQKLETADDYQAAGVDFEDAAGKWRAGDAVKSMRFFQRAIEVYTQGLQKHPNSFDLAYNKARAELEIVTHPILVKQLQLPVLAQLEITLQSHRLALNLDKENPDILFNTAQVLTSVAEELSKDENTSTADAIRILEEALELQARCLQMQEVKYQDHQRLQQRQDTSDTPVGSSDDHDDGGATIADSNPTHSEMHEDQWFTIEEPVTIDTLIDSVLAQLNTLTTLCGVISSSPDSAPTQILPRVEEFSSNLLVGKLPLLTDSSSTRNREIALTKANFVSSLLEAGFRTNTIDAETYKRERDAAFAAPPLDQGSTADVLISHARSLISFNSALADAPDHNNTQANTRWNALSTAITLLNKAPKLARVWPEDLSTTHLLRGDTSLLEYTMSLAPVNHPAATANAAQLLKNAEVFYRNASKLSADAEDKSVAALRSGVALFLAGGDRSSILAVVQSKGEAWVKQQLDDMSIEGLISADFTF